MAGNCCPALPSRQKSVEEVELKLDYYNRVHRAATVALCGRLELGILEDHSNALASSDARRTNTISLASSTQLVSEVRHATA